jgi:hypothetical protein
VNGSTKPAEGRLNRSQSSDSATRPASETLHSNWRSLIKYCEENPFVSMRLNIANGVPASAEQVVPTLRFDKPDPRGRSIPPSSG